MSSISERIARELEAIRAANPYVTREGSGRITLCIPDAATSSNTKPAVEDAAIVEYKIPTIGVNKFSLDRYRRTDCWKLQYNDPEYVKPFYFYQAPDEEVLDIRNDYLSDFDAKLRKLMVLSMLLGNAVHSEVGMYYSLANGSARYGDTSSGRLCSPLAKRVIQSLDQVGLQMVGSEFLLSVGFPSQPVILKHRLKKGDVLRKFVFPTPTGTTEFWDDNIERKRFLVGAIDFLLVPREGSASTSTSRNDVIIAELKTTSADEDFESMGLRQIHAVQLMHYAWMFNRMARQAGTGLRVSGLLLIVVHTQGDLRMWTYRFDPRLMTEANADTQLAPFVADLSTDELADLSPQRLDFLIGGPLAAVRTRPRRIAGVDIHAQVKLAPEYIEAQLRAQPALVNKLREYFTALAQSLEISVNLESSSLVSVELPKLTFSKFAAALWKRLTKEQIEELKAAGLDAPFNKKTLRFWQELVRRVSDSEATRTAAAYTEPQLEEPAMRVKYRDIEALSQEIARLRELVMRQNARESWERKWLPVVGLIAAVSVVVVVITRKWK